MLHQGLDLARHTTDLMTEKGALIMTIATIANPTVKAAIVKRSESANSGK
jgi:hypothetical protein